MTEQDGDQDSGPASHEGKPAEAEPDQGGGISDDQLPEDLQPSEDNPLAEPLEPGETAEVDLNEPSRSYAEQQEEAGTEAGNESGTESGTESGKESGDADQPEEDSGASEED